MAFFDDRNFLLSHIRHSYITCDDTGMCEMVMLNEIVTDKPVKDEFDDIPDMKILNYYDNAVDSDLLEMSQSCDIVSDMELIGAHRHRSNTAQRLERLKNERKNQAKTKNVQWKENPYLNAEGELSQLFPRKELSCKEKVQTRKSFLSEQLLNLPSAPNNHFNEYARFDGKLNQGSQTKKIAIFLTMLPPNDRNYPMEVVTLASARVQDLIGLICWQYTNEEREPTLKPNVAYYCLHIAEENGEVDDDFPSLDPREPVAKFGFPVLALVEKEEAEEVVPEVIIFIEEQFVKIPVRDLSVSLEDVVETLLKHHKWLAKKGVGFHLKYRDLDSIVSLNTKLKDAGTLEFNLIRNDSSNEDEDADDWGIQQMSVMEAPLYHSYMVHETHKLGRNTKVQLGVSGEKVEINPLPQKGIWSRQQKAVTYNIETIAACELITKKCNASKAVFKLVHHSGHVFKSHVFETDNRQAHEIVKKLQYILEMHSTAIRREYELFKEQKAQRKLQQSRHSFN